jgi:lysophospholipase L1-like esterase
MCSPTTCSPVRAGAVLYADRGHLSRAGAMLLAGDIAPALDWVGGRVEPRP